MITPKAHSLPKALVFTPYPTGLLFLPGLYLRARVSDAKALAGALGPTSGPLKKCSLVPAMGILSTDSQILVLFYCHNCSAFFCLTRDQGGNPHLGQRLIEWGRSQST